MKQIEPKDKAIELVNSFIAIGCLFANAKKCAQKEVDDILNLPVVWFYPSAIANPEATEEFWQEVKTEINKL
jgi:hypothetical protein